MPIAEQEAHGTRKCPNVESQEQACAAQEFEKLTGKVIRKVDQSQADRGNIEAEPSRGHGKDQDISSFNYTVTSSPGSKSAKARYKKFKNWIKRIFRLRKEIPEPLNLIQYDAIGGESTGRPMTTRGRLEGYARGGGSTRIPMTSRGRLEGYESGLESTERPMTSRGRLEGY